MIKWLVGLLVVSFLFLSVLTSVRAENTGVSVGAKVGYFTYEGGSRQWHGEEDYFSSEIGYGGFIKYTNRDYFIRLDYDRSETGNEFHEQPTFNGVGYAYDQFDLNQNIWGLTLGKGFKYLYCGVGVDYIDNSDSEVVGYAVYPLNISIDDAVGYHILLGLKKDISKKCAIFIEAKKLWGDADVTVEGSSSHTTEDVGSLSYNIGVEFKF